MLLNKNRKVLLILLTISFLGFIFSGCDKKVEYTTLQTKYIDICEKSKSSKSFTKKNLEELIGIKVSEEVKGKDKDSNAYTFKIDNEKLLIYTDNNNDELLFIQYNNLIGLELTYSLKTDMNFGEYYGFTGKYNSESFENQKNQLNLYLKNNNIPQK
ncbi:hypothetical protein CHF27_012295 [Romboutsia maritimum]|uniref:Uncharacterized protein n=1 Tax=Romboutsia maritimum TaxID=2020948 RepID=A0A371IQ86_9FIRM|nr:hypothetical protein [Romboutsia maritimum]RDY22647.1 hypothetical protein CHF27_012295 [Romboutsia maritimum]